MGKDGVEQIKKRKPYEEIGAIFNGNEVRRMMRFTIAAIVK